MPFRLTRKIKSYVPRTKYLPKRSIISVEEVGEKECQCISVDSLDNLYMTNNCILTHNTTMMKHLAWKYGGANQKWLYLVFNTKNKVEAKQKFPPWCEVATTNGFLGGVIQSSENKSKIKQTERIVGLQKEEGGGKLDKSRIMADGSEFSAHVSKLGFPSNQSDKVDKILEDADDYVTKSVRSLLNGMRYTFKVECIRVLGLAKSFAADPRDKEQSDKIINKIFEDYDVETDLGDIKAKINNYKPTYKNKVLDFLDEILGYDFMQKDFKEEIIESVTWLLVKSMPHALNAKHKIGKHEYNLGEFRDFNDDLWFAAVHANEIHWPKYDVVLADEVQDFNVSQRIVLHKLYEAGAKIVAVGDRNQSIYRFRGSDSGGFDALSDQLQNTSKDKNVQHTLSNNYRSRKAILDYANQNTHVKNLKQGKFFKDEGKVTDQELSYEDTFAMLAKEKQQGRIEQTAFISRTNEPLVHAALKLMAKGVPFVIVGKDIAKDLAKHINKIMSSKGVREDANIETLRNELENHSKKEKEGHEGKSSKKAYLQELNDTTDALLSSIDTYVQNAPNQGRGVTIAQFKRWLKASLSGLDVAESEQDLEEYTKKKEDGVILTTAHKAKGLEFTRTFILRNDQFPHPKAKRPEDLEQEANAKFIAYTRAMKDMHIINLDGQPGVKKKKE